MSEIKIHKEIITKLTNYIKNNNVPNIIFHGPNGSGKKHIINTIINKIYNKDEINNFVMFVNCAHGKGIKFIREDLKLFSKTNIIKTNQGNFKSIVLLNADKLTIDAQSALRRCIELFSHSTRFFISVENINKLLKPILSRFCDVYVPHPKIRGSEISIYQHKIKNQGPFYKNTSKNIGKLYIYLKNIQVKNENIVEISKNIYEKGFSAQNVIECIKSNGLENVNKEDLNELSFLFYKIKREFRNEKLLILYVLKFLFFRNNHDLENITIN